MTIKALINSLVLGPIYRYYGLLFSKPSLYGFNKVLYNLSLRGMGIFNYQGRSSGEFHFLKKYLAGKINPVVFDIGANIGNYSKEIMEINSSSTVYAFEPLPGNYEQLKEVENINSYNAGCSNKNGSLKIYNYVNGSQHASLYKDVIETLHKTNSIECEIGVIKLDDFIVSNNIETIDLIKIDTEGHELAVLQGLSHAIRAGKIKAVQFEFGGTSAISRIFLKDFFEILSDFSLYRLLPSDLIKLEYNPELCEIFAYQNIVAILR